MLPDVPHFVYPLGAVVVEVAQRRGHRRNPQRFERGRGVFVHRASHPQCDVDLGHLVSRLFHFFPEVCVLVLGVFQFVVWVGVPAVFYLDHCDGYFGLGFITVLLQEQVRFVLRL